MEYPDLSSESFFTWANRPRIFYKAGVREELGVAHPFCASYI